MKENENNSINLLKQVCAFWVVTLHYGFINSNIIEPLSRIAVPCFAIISGYYLPKSEYVDWKFCKTKIHKLLLLIWPPLLLSALYRLFSGVSVSIREVVLFPLTDDIELFRPQFWYIFALATVYILLPLDKYLHFMKYSWVLLLVSPLARYGVNPLLSWWNSIGDTNFLFSVLPCMSLGKVLPLPIDRIRFRSSYGNTCFQILLMATFTAFLYVEYLFLNNSVSTSYYMATIPLAVSVVLFCIDHPLSTQSSIARFGKHYSAKIYAWHSVFIFYCLPVLHSLHASLLVKWFAPILIFFGTVLLVKIYYCLLRKLHVTKDE